MCCWSQTVLANVNPCGQQNAMQLCSPFGFDTIPQRCLEIPVTWRGSFSKYKPSLGFWFVLPGQTPGASASWWREAQHTSQKAALWKIKNDLLKATRSWNFTTNAHKHAECCFSLASINANTNAYRFKQLTFEHKHQHNDAVWCILYPLRGSETSWDFHTLQTSVHSISLSISLEFCWILLSRHVFMNFGLAEGRFSHSFFEPLRDLLTVTFPSAL